MLARAFSVVRNNEMVPAIARRWPLAAPQVNGMAFFRRPHSSKVYMSVADDDQVSDYAKTAESTWNVPGLRKEVQRLLLRCHKKVGKANQKLRSANEIVEKLSGDDNASLEELEHCPDVKELESELQDLQERLHGLNELEEQLTIIKKKESILPESVAALAIRLGVDDQPPAREPRGPGKMKGPREETSARKPYRRYYSFRNTEIRVGKKAEDNDQLTLSRQHRDDRGKSHLRF